MNTPSGGDENADWLLKGGTAADAEHDDKHEDPHDAHDAHDDETEPAPAPASAKSGRRRRRLSRKGKILWGVAWVMLFLLVGSAGTGLWVYSHLKGNIATVDIDHALGPDRPAPLAAGGEDILLLGSDSRAGANGTLIGDNTADTPGARSDTAMVVHISAGRTDAVVVSIPRDTLVPRPACTTAQGTNIRAAKQVMFNSIFSVGGPTCTVKAVEALTGLRMDHFVQIDFAGFKNLVDALGGVDITVDQAIDDPYTHLHIPAGTSTLHGTQALEFVRTRYSVGDGSDLGRIQLQQRFMLAVLTKVQQEKSLSDPIKLYRIADAATKSLTTDSDLGSLPGLLKFAGSIKGLDSSNLQMIQLPVVYDRADPNRVLPDTATDRALWTALRAGQPVPDSATDSPAHGTVP
ncbi:LCP family protein [Streptacidiphilus sp. N1-12]|uniref:LCP family protein n=2 Tax=Streptacidiphilus alkalitolerans TaxID=3342712 RepID=A0ABV6XE88_9ACTN